MTGAAARNNIRGTSRSMGVWKPPITDALSAPRALAQSCAFRIMSSGQALEQKKAMGARVRTDAATLAMGGSLGIVLVRAHAKAHVIIYDVINFFCCQTNCPANFSINFVDYRLG